MNAICKRCGWVMANPESGCLDCNWEIYNKVTNEIGESNE